METYKASLDTTAKILTGFVFLLLIFGIVLCITLSPWYGGVVIIVIPIILLISTYIYSVKSYQIADENLFINRRFSMLDKKIPLSNIEGVELVNKEDFKWTIRTFGNGGLFGYTGYYANNKLGSFRMYATNRKTRILIILKDKKDKIVLSPDDSGMVEVLKKRLNKQA